MIKKKGKKLLSLFLALALIVTMIPVSGLTANAAADIVVSTIELSFASGGSTTPAYGESPSKITIANGTEYKVDSAYDGTYTYKEGQNTLYVTDPVSPAVTLTNDISLDDNYTVTEDATKYTKDGKTYSVAKSGDKVTSITDEYGNVLKTLSKASDGTAVANGYISGGYKWQGKTTEDSTSNASTIMTSSDKFQYNSAYKVTFRITPQDGYKFSTSGMNVTINDSTVAVTAKKETISYSYYDTNKQRKTGSYDTGNYLVTITFANTNTKVSASATIDTLDNPVAGQALDTEITCPTGTQLAQTDGLKWYKISKSSNNGGTPSGASVDTTTIPGYDATEIDPAKDKAQYGTMYAAVINLVAASGYEFGTDGSAVSVTSKVTNGIKAQQCVPSASSSKIIVIYNATAKAKFKSVDAIVKTNVTDVSKLDADSNGTLSDNELQKVLGSDEAGTEGMIPVETEAGTVLAKVKWTDVTGFNATATGNITYTTKGTLSVTSTSDLAEVKSGNSIVDCVDYTSLNGKEVSATFTVLGTNMVATPSATVNTAVNGGEEITKDASSGSYIIKKTDGTKLTQAVLILSGSTTIHYNITTDGNTPSDPTTYSAAYSSSNGIVITGKAGDVITIKIKARAYDSADSTKMSEVYSETFTIAFPGDAVNSVALTDITAPVAGQALDTTAVCTSSGITTATNNSYAVSWTAGGSAASGTAKYGTEYTASVTLSAAAGSEFPSAMSATVNGYSAKATVSADKKSVTVTYTFDATAKAKLTSITAPAAVTVDNGKTEAEIKAALPTTVAIVTEDTSVTSASVAWTIDGAYTPSTAASTVKFNGTVTLPTTVEQNNVSLTTSIIVNVKAAVASAPTPGVAEGTYENAQTVALSTTETNATIYYTLDGTEPTTSSAKYEAPIAVSETTTIKAITVVEGKENSPVASFTYTIVSSTPNDPTNPDNPSTPNDPSTPDDPTNPDNPGVSEKQSQTIELKKSSYTLGFEKNGTKNLKATAQTALSYSSSDASVVTVNEKGIVTMKAIGTATITITAAETDEYKEATATVTVTVKPAQVTGVKLTTTKKKGKLTVAFNKLKGKVTNYQIQYSSDGGATWNSVTASTNAKNIKVAEKLTAKTTFSVRVRGVKKLADGSKILGKWSKTKKVMVK